MKALILLVFFTVSLPLAHAQVGTDYLIQEINKPTECEEVTISGANSYVPFNLKVFFPQMKSIPAIKNPAPSEGEKPETNVVLTEKSLIFFTNSTYKYQFDMGLHYDEPNPGIMIQELWSNGNLVSRTVENVDGTDLCKRYIITTTAPPKLPTLNDILTNAGVEAVQQFQYIVPEIKNLEAAIGVNSTVITFQALANIVLWFYLIRTISQHKSEEIKTRKQVLITTKHQDDLVKKIEKQAERIEETNTNLKNLIPLIEKRADSFVEIMRVEFNSMMLDMDRKFQLNMKKEEMITKERMDLDKKKIEMEEKQRMEKMKKTSVSDEKLSELASLIREPTKKIGKFASSLVNLGKSDATKYEREIDMTINEDTTEEQLFLHYSENDYEDNQDLYKKYWKMSNSDQSNRVAKLKTEVLDKVLNKQFAKMKENNENES